MTMGVVDTVMVGHLPHPAITISAVALGQVLYNTLAFGVGGVLLGLDTYISQAHGAGEWDDANKWLLSGLVLAGMLSALLMGMVWLGPLAMVRMPVDHEVMRQSIRFLGALNWGTLPLFLYMTLRRYLQAFNHVRPIAAAVVTANVVNAALDWLLLYGHRWSFVGKAVAIPAYGVVGAAVSTALARVTLAAFVGVAVYSVDRRHGYGLRKRMTETPCWIDAGRLRRLVRLGAPVGGQIFVEIAIFAAVTAMIGTRWGRGAVGGARDCAELRELHVYGPLCNLGGGHGAGGAGSGPWVGHRGCCGGMDGDWVGCGFHVVQRWLWCW